MKVKIKGLVFVGFAAAILSANAMAANEAQTVTSKAYTEATYQHKVEGTNNQLVQSTGTAGTVKYLTISEDSEDVHVTNGVGKVVSGAAVAGAIADVMETVNENAVTGSTYIDTDTTGDNTQVLIRDNMIVGTETDVTNGTTQLTTAAGVKGYAQKYSHSPNQISDGAGGWKALDQAINNDTAASPNAPTTAAVKTYVDNALNNGEHDTYQPYEAAANKISGANGTWKALNSDVTDTAAAVQGFDGDNAASTTAIRTYVQGKIVDSVAGTSTTEAPSQGSVKSALDTKENLSDKAAAIVTDSTAAGYNSNSTDKYASTKAVYDYVQSQTHGNVIPGQNPNVCTAAHPCALVNEAGALHWYTMAQSNYAGGELGDAQ